MVEEWRKITGVPGYEVSNLGRVRSWHLRGDRPKNREWALFPHLLTLYKGKRGVVVVTLHKNKQAKPHPVSRLVLSNFVREPLSGEQVLHWDDDPFNNSLENLRWGTSLENYEDARRNGGKPPKTLVACPNCQSLLHVVQVSGQNSLAQGKMKLRIPEGG